LNIETTGSYIRLQCFTATLVVLVLATNSHAKSCAWANIMLVFQDNVMMTNLTIFVAAGYTLIVSKQDIW